MSLELFFIYGWMVKLHFYVLFLIAITLCMCFMGLWMFKQEATTTYMIYPTSVKQWVLRLENVWSAINWSATQRNSVKFVSDTSLQMWTLVWCLRLYIFESIGSGHIWSYCDYYKSLLCSLWSVLIRFTPEDLRPLLCFNIDRHIAIRNITDFSDIFYWINQRKYRLGQKSDIWDCGFLTNNQIVW